MIAYPFYKDSGIFWLGELPEHWRILKLKHLVKIKNGKDHKAVEVDIGYPVVGSGGQFSYASEYLYEGESVLFGRKGTINKPLYINGKFWTIDTMFYTEIYEKIIPKFLYYAALSIPYDFYSTQTALPSMTQQDLNNHLLAVPPELEEQQQLIKYLDWKTTKINKLIKAKKKLIALLKEQKQNIINEAVTKGINPGVEMKDSGVDWLGEIPEHWGIRKIKHCVYQVNEQTDVCKKDEVYLALEHIESWSGKITPPISEVEFDSKVKKYEPNDILFGKLRPYLAKVAVPKFKGVCVGEFLVLRTLKNITSPAFFSTLLRSPKIINLINTSTFGAKMPRADWSFIGSIFVGFPDLNEQQEIVKYIKSETSLLDRAILRTEKEIELIHEYKTRLISDVVTGKIDVRSLQIPDFEPIEPEIDFSDESSKEEVMMEDIEE